MVAKEEPEEMVVWLVLRLPEAPEEQPVQLVQAALCMSVDSLEEITDLFKHIHTLLQM
jgi:hypothetical protein